MHLHDIAMTSGIHSAIIMALKTYSSPLLCTAPNRLTFLEPVATSQKSLALDNVKPSLQTDPHFPLKYTSSLPAIRLLTPFATSLTENVSVCVDKGFH